MVSEEPFLIVLLFAMVRSHGYDSLLVVSYCTFRSQIRCLFDEVNVYVNKFGTVNMGFSRKELSVCLSTGLHHSTKG